MHTSKHHLWWPRRDYKTDIERRFRGLPCNVVELQHDTHLLIHEYQEPPTKPLPMEMARAIRHHDQGRCPCNHHHERSKSA